MSYILDALRKADAQRARDPVRGIHAQPLRGASSLQAGRGLRTWVWAAAMAAIAAMAWAGWFMYHDRSPVKGVASPQVAIVQPSVVAQAPSMQPPAPPAAPAPVVGSVIQPPPSVAPPPTAAQVAVAPPPGWPLTGGDPRNTSRPSMVATPPATGLPPDAPKLAINGGVFSASKSQRMLIVNGQVFNEGGEVATGVVLEEIRAKTAVLRFRGARYTVSY